MDISAKLRYLRIAPRKARLVADAIRGMDVEQAQEHLQFIRKRAGEPILKLLNSAAANAKQNFSKMSGLYIKKIFVDQGPVYKRFHPQAHGVAALIKKKTSHITIILDERIKK